MKKLLMVPFMVLALLVSGAGSASAAEQKLNMELVGTNDLQARSTYQPTVHRYPGGPVYLFRRRTCAGDKPGDWATSAIVESAHR